MIVETLPLVGSSTPLWNHIMVIGDVPVRMSQTRVMLAPSITYAGEPIWTSMSPGRTVAGCGINGPSSISGGFPNIIYIKINNSDWVSLACAI